VLPIYASARDAKLAAFDRDPSSTTARREVREARRAVAQALRATSNGVVPAAPTARYWEEYAGGDGKRYLAFAQLALGSSEVDKLVAQYARSSTALGVTVVDGFPLVAWRHPRVERGAIVVATQPGSLQGAGITEQQVVLAIGGRDISDAASFARFATDEHAAISARGGTLRLKVQTPDPSPREFAIQLVKTGGEPTPPRNGNGTTRPPDNTGSGGVNVWDRYNGRNDPTK
jgi:hypothetical protein